MSRASGDISADASFETVLSEIGGVGVFHLVTFVLAIIPVAITSASYVNCIVSAAILDYRYGRLTIAVIGLVGSSFVGLIKTFSFNYPMYITLEFFESGLNTFTFGSIYVLLMELTGSRYRVLVSALIPLSFPVGHAFFAFITMCVHDFRVFMRTSYVPGLFLFVYIWLLPESCRWLFVTGRSDRAVKVLKRIARTNGKELSAKSIEMLKSKYDIELIAKTTHEAFENEVVNDRSVFRSFSVIFISRKLILRFVVSCFQWITCCLCFYGLSMSSFSIPGANRYVSLVCVISAEVPGILIKSLVVNRIKRRTLLFATFLLTAISIIVTSLISEAHSAIVLMCFMIGKSGLSSAFVLLYRFTAEQWPTNLRTTMLNTCSMIGRIGFMVAPFVIVLDAEYGSLSKLLFAGTAFTSAALVLFNPETFGKKLPDTIEEAERL